MCDGGQKPIYLHIIISAVPGHSIEPHMCVTHEFLTSLQGCILVPHVGNTAFKLDSENSIGGAATMVGPGVAQAKARRETRRAGTQYVSQGGPHAPGKLC
jgi:hypothetical protein